MEEEEVENPITQTQNHNQNHTLETNLSPSLSTLSMTREIQTKFNDEPQLLLEKSGRSECSIFRVPPSLDEIDTKAYRPRIVSIGPYHHGIDHLTMIEEHKIRFVFSLLNRNNNLSDNLHPCFQSLFASEEKLRLCFSENTARFKTREFIEMMIRDGCFILELILQALEIVPRNPDYPIFSMDWILPTLVQDFLKLENQIPFSVLQKLYEIALPEANEILQNLILKFFRIYLKLPGRRFSKKIKTNHVLDLVRDSLQPYKTEQETNDDITHPREIQPVNKLNEAGIKFQARRRNGIGFLDIKFSNGALKIPELRMDSFVICLILNSVAFEQCYGHTEKFMTNYVVFMNCLMHKPDDARFLSDCKIVGNCYGTDEDVAGFFGRVGREVGLDSKKSYLGKVIEEVDEYCWNNWRVKWARLKKKYFDSPWSFMVALAVVTLLFLTVLQALFAYLAYSQLKN